MSLTSGCMGKYPHTSWTQAQTTITRTRRVNRIRKRHVDAVQVYRCKFCRRWHVGRTYHLVMDHYG